MVSQSIGTWNLAATSLSTQQLKVTPVKLGIQSIGSPSEMFISAKGAS